ncbi:MAG: hypothetical protein AAGG80_06375 [Pseudomonadota bacterium]
MSRSNFGTNLLNAILPFVGIGIFIVVIILAVIFLSYIFIIGALIGLVLFVFAFIKQLFTGRKKTKVPQKTQHGRTYDYDDLEK